MTIILLPADAVKKALEKTKADATNSTMNVSKSLSLVFLSRCFIFVSCHLIDQENTFFKLPLVSEYYGK